MDEKAATALQLSIEHWERLTKCTTYDEVVFEGLGSAVCALCDAFVFEADDDFIGCADFIGYADFIGCAGCPVSAHTGQVSCSDTPYYKIESYINDSSGPFISDEWCKLATAELDFLKGLRE